MAQIENPSGQPRKQVQFVPNVPNVVNPGENEFQRESHYLSFLGSYIAESPNSASAYYAAIDPTNAKANFPDWLKKAGFIGQTSDWNPSGPQLFACDQPGCNYPKLNPDGTPRYGPNIINTDSHAIVLNAADLGFVRNQFIRCVDPANAKSTNPCAARNPKIYTYLENYPVAPFSGVVVGTDPPFTCSGPSGGVVESVVSCFPTLSGYPTDPEATAAIQSAISRPFGVKWKNGKLVPIDTARIADVAFEWAPPVGNPNSSTRFGQLYAYQVGNDASGKITETLDYGPNFDQAKIVDFQAGGFNQLTINAATDKFAPNLDGVGFKQHPGVCLVCHGGAPAFVPTGGPYPRAGNINGFRFLPLDNANLLFPTVAFQVTTALPAGFTHDFTLDAQERQIREYNIAVLKTVPTYAETDDQGTARVPHLREVILGWYEGFPGDTTMSNPKQNPLFIPKGWREAPNGPAPNGAEALYKEVVGPSCRSCHFNRELSLDFGTYANFHQESDLQQLSFLGSCKQDNNANPNAKFMPLALLTFVRFWETQNGTTHVLTGGTTLSNEVDRLARDFHFSSVQGYCNTHP